MVFPLDGDRRSTTATGRAIVAEALEPVDPIGARAALAETTWRAGYPMHFRRLVEAGLDSAPAAVEIADCGLSAVHTRMRWGHADGSDVPLRDARADEARPLHTELIEGIGLPESSLTLPFQGRRLAGSDLADQLYAWVRRGIIEPSPHLLVVGNQVLSAQVYRALVNRRSPSGRGSPRVVGPVRPHLRGVGSGV